MCLQALQKSFANQTTMMSKTAVEEVDEVKKSQILSPFLLQLNLVKIVKFRKIVEKVKRRKIRFWSFVLELNPVDQSIHEIIISIILQVPYSYQCRTCSLVQVPPPSLINPPLQVDKLLCFVINLTVGLYELPF